MRKVRLWRSLGMALLGALFALSVCHRSVGSAPAGAAMDKQPKMTWLVIRYMGDTKESLPPTVLYVGEAGLRAVKKYLGHDPLRKAAIDAADMQRVTERIGKAQWFEKRLAPSAFDPTRPCYFTLGRTAKPIVMALDKAEGRRTLRALAKETLKDATAIRLVEEYAPMFD